MEFKGFSTPSHRRDVAETHVGTIHKVLNQLVMACRTMNFAQSTENCYRDWIDDYLRFHKDCAGCWVHPDELREAAAAILVGRAESALRRSATGLPGGDVEAPEIPL